MRLLSLFESRKSEFMNMVAMALRANAGSNPLLKHLANNKNEMAELLSGVPRVLRDMGEAGWLRMNASPKGLQEFLQLLIKDYVSRSPDLNPKLYKNDKEGFDPAGKLIDLTNQMAKNHNCDPSPYVEALKRLIDSNRDRVTKWAREINDPEQMLQKFIEWRKRGLI